MSLDIPETSPGGRRWLGIRGVGMSVSMARSKATSCLPWARNRTGTNRCGKRPNAMPTKNQCKRKTMPGVPCPTVSPRHAYRGPETYPRNRGYRGGGMSVFFSLSLSKKKTPDTTTFLAAFPYPSMPVVRGLFAVHPRVLRRVPLVAVSQDTRHRLPHTVSGRGISCLNST